MITDGTRGAFSSTAPTGRQQVATCVRQRYTTDGASAGMSSPQPEKGLREPVRADRRDSFEALNVPTLRRGRSRRATCQQLSWRRCASIDRPHASSRSRSRGARRRLDCRFITAIGATLGRVGRLPSTVCAALGSGAARCFSMMGRPISEARLRQEWLTMIGLVSYVRLRNLTVSATRPLAAQG